jgi:hypothetical protein
MGQYTAAVSEHLVLPAQARLPPLQEQRMVVLGHPVPKAVPIRLLIDTGAKRTTLVPGVVNHLQPVTGGEARLVTALGSELTDLVWVRLDFPEAGLASFPDVLVARHPMPPVLSEFHGVLGRDLLRRFESFEYQGRRGRYCLRDSPGWLGWLRRHL